MEQKKLLNKITRCQNCNFYDIEKSYCIIHKEFVPINSFCLKGVDKEIESDNDN